MLYYDRIGVSEGIDVSKTCKLKECIICHYWYFLDKGSSFNHRNAKDAMIFSWWKKTLNTLLVNCIIIIKLSHYIKCFLKQVVL